MREVVSLEEACARMKAGGAVLLDTDTVAGIAVSTDRPDALEQLFDAKGRDREKPIAWLVPEIASLDVYGRGVPAYARKLAERFWPGALTLIVNASKDIDPRLLSKDSTVGLRMPDNRDCLDLMSLLGCAMATTSANISGLEAPASITDAQNDFAKAVPIAASGQQVGEKAPALPSTVIDCTGDEPCLKRQGAIPFSDIMKEFGAIQGEPS